MAEEGEIDPSIWYRLYTAEGKAYYYNRANQITQWEEPEVEEGKLIDISQTEQAGEKENEDEDANRRLTEEEEQQLALQKEIERLKRKAEQASTLLRTKKKNAKAAQERKAQVEKIYTAAVWTKKFTHVTQGMDSGDGEVYYYNTETGETQWDRPEEYMSDDEVLEVKLQSEIEFDRSKTVNEILSDLDVSTDVFRADRDFLYGQTGTTATFLRDKSKLSKRQVRDRSTNRMKQFYLALKYAGSESDWVQVFSQNNHEIARNTYAYLGPKVGTTPDEMRSDLVKIIVNVCSMFPNVTSHLVDGTWDVSYEIFLKHCERGISVEKGKEKLRDIDTVKAWLIMFLNVLYDASDSVDQNVAPSPGFMGDLVHFLAHEEEKIYFLGSQLVLGLLDIYVEHADEEALSIQDSQPHELVRGILKSADSHVVVEAVLHFVNEQHYPYNNLKLLKQCLHFLRITVSNADSVKLLSMADTKIVFDLVLVEIANLPPEDLVRVEYMNIMYLMLSSPRWKDTGRYRNTDIAKALDNIISQTDYGMAQESTQLAVKTLTNFQEYLT